MDPKRRSSPTLHPYPAVTDEIRAAFMRCWVASINCADYVRADFLTIDRCLSPIILGDPLAARVAFRRCQAKMASHPAYAADDWRLVEAALFDEPKTN